MLQYYFKQFACLALCLIMLSACNTYPDVELAESYAHGDYMIDNISIIATDQVSRLGRPLVTENEYDITRAHLMQKLPAALAPYGKGKKVDMEVTLHSVNMSISTAKAMLIGDSMYVNSDVILRDPATGQDVAKTAIYARGQALGGVAGVMADGLMSDDWQFAKVTTEYSNNVAKALYPQAR